MNEQVNDDNKFRIVLAGGKVDEDAHGNVVSEEEAARLIVDPLYKFPYDEPFMSAEEVKFAVKDSNSMREKIATGKIEATQQLVDLLWDDHRVDAALKGDDVARRAAVNDVLWLNYKRWIKEHKTCSVDRLKHFVEMDLARSKLYPKPSYPDQAKLIRERFQYEKENNLPHTPISPMLPPPQWYIDHLKKRGVYDDYLKKINEVVTRKVNDET